MAESRTAAGPLATTGVMTVAVVLERVGPLALLANLRFMNRPAGPPRILMRTSPHGVSRRTMPLRPRGIEMVPALATCTSLNSKLLDVRGPAMRADFSSQNYFRNPAA